MNNAIYDKIKDQFRSRVQAARTQGDNLKPTSAAYQKKQAEFFTGAMAALVAVFNQDPEDIIKIMEEAGGMQTVLHGKAMPPAWVFGIMRGEDLLAEENNINKTKP